MNGSPAHSPPDSGWGWKKTGLIILLAMLGHLTLLFLFGAKKNSTPRPATHVPVFRLAAAASELVTLTDPTWFALPHAEDFAAAHPDALPGELNRSFRYGEPASFLATPAAETLGATFAAYNATNALVPVQLDFKPAPQFEETLPADAAWVPPPSVWRLSGGIADRRLLNRRSFAAPTIAVNDVIPPSRVQVLVDKSGKVLSNVLLEPSGNADADQIALALARSLQFVPANEVTLGEIIFDWQTAPVVKP